VIEAQDAMRVVDTISKNLAGVAAAKSNFQRLPDTFWGYYARGHDGKGGAFAVILTYSEKSHDVDELVKMYEQWVAKNKSVSEEKSGVKSADSSLSDGSSHDKQS